MLDLKDEVRAQDAKIDVLNEKTAENKEAASVAVVETRALQVQLTVAGETAKEQRDRMHEEMRVLNRLMIQLLEKE